MLVCHCHRVNDARVDQVLAAGADGVRGVVRATRAGTGCGGCVPEVCRLLQDHFAREAYNASVAAAALDETVAQLEITVA